jgi:hypothetical protein
LNRTSTGHVPYGPLQRRLLGLAGLFSALIIALFVFHALHSGETGLNAVAEAAERTARQPGAKLAIEVKYTFEHEGRSVQISGTGDGVFDAPSGRSEANLSVPVPGHAAVTVDSIATATKIYERSSTFANQLPTGKSWLEMEPLLGHSEKTAIGSEGGATNTLTELRAVGGGAERVGQETVRGHLTTHYKGTIELGHIAEVLREHDERELTKEFEVLAEQQPTPVPVDVWVDGKGLIRQVEMVEPLPFSSSSGITGSMDMRMQFFAFGHRSHIPLPPKHEVFDYTPALRAELGLTEGTAYGPLEPPAKAKPLSVSAFHRQAVRMCHRFEAEAEALKKPGLSLVQQIRPVNRLLGRSIREMATLPPPARLASGYHEYLTAVAKRAERLLGYSRALELGESGSPLFDQLKADEGEEKALARSIGIDGCVKETPGSSAGSEV